jgi:hypothetical protein
MNAYLHAGNMVCGFGIFLPLVVIRIMGLAG